MAIWNRKTSDESSSPPATTYVDESKGGYVPDSKEYETAHHAGVIETAEESETKLRRDLKARHITMIAIGGAIGTGLLIGTGAALAKAGPASILIKAVDSLLESLEPLNFRV